MPRCPLPKSGHVKRGNIVLLGRRLERGFEPVVPGVKPGTLILKTLIKTTSDDSLKYCLSEKNEA